MTRYDFTPFNRATIGFDRIFDDLDRVLSNTATTAYPPYNIERLDENRFVISLAVAGFTMDDLEVTHDGNELTVTGTSPEPKETTYLHKGIATREFTRVFTVADHVEVVNAELENGLLNVYLKREIPEELQPKKIAITYKK
jgi:molecular chaperone IbpA